MMWLALFGLTALVVLLPMLPAIIEWARPSDVVPLHIDTQDALDPPFLARSFVARLFAAVDNGETQLGRTLIAKAPGRGLWPLMPEEERAGLSRRAWHAVAHAALPPGVSFLAEVAAQGDLRTSMQCSYRGLWAGGSLHLAPRASVLRWAHGAEVEVAPGCRLDGRVSADERITLRGESSFTLLHARAVHFAAAEEAAASAPPAGPVLFTAGLPPPVAWDAAAARGTCDEPLDIASDSAWYGDLVCRGDLVLGTGCQVHGSLKARGDIGLDDRCRITGSVVAEGRIELGARCSVRGSVVSETAIVLGAGCRIGAPGAPATVAAPSIVVAPGVIVHGTLWAGKRGLAQAPTVMALVPEVVEALPQRVAA